CEGASHDSRGRGNPGAARSAYAGRLRRAAGFPLLAGASARRDRFPSRGHKKETLRGGERGLRTAGAGRGVPGCEKRAWRQSRLAKKRRDRKSTRLNSSHVKI